MKILLLSPWFPWPPFGGAVIRVYETLRHLSRRHRVTLLSPVGHSLPEQPLSALADQCEGVVAVPVSDTVQAQVRRMGLGLLRGMPLLQGLHRDRQMIRQVRRLTARNAYDIIHVEHTFMSPYLAHVSPQSRARTVLSMPDIDSIRFRRELRTLPWGARRVALLTDRVLFGSWEGEAFRQFDGISTVSAVEEQWVRDHAPHARVALVPNGVDTEYFGPAPPPSFPRTIVFTGLMNYPPNVDAVVWFSDAILPLVVARHPEIRFLIIGDKPTAEVVALGRRPQVQVTGRVPDVRPYVASCAAVVVPLRAGAGTRLKILEAMAMERPVVSTTQGAEGLNTTDGHNILIGDTPQAVANHLCALIESSDMRAQLGRAGRQLVEEIYQWSACFRPLEDLYETLISAGDARALRPVRELAS